MPAVPLVRVVIRLSQKANFPMKKVRLGRFENKNHDFWLRRITTRTRGAVVLTFKAHATHIHDSIQKMKIDAP
jgi:hypothetical protein